MNPEENNESAPFAGPAPIASETPAPETPVPEAPITPEVPAPENLAAPETPAEPVIPEAPVEPTMPETPVVPVAPAAPVEETSPSLDQVAADLTSAAANNTLESTGIPTESAAPIEQTSVGPTMAELASVEPTPFATESAPSVGESTPAVEVAAAPEMPAVSEMPAAPEMSSPDMQSSETTIPPAGTSAEDEEPPLVPAEPVPGSIGSAISYSDSTPDHSIPTVKPKKISSLSNTLKLSKENLRLVLIIGVGIVLVAVVVVVLIFIIHGSSSKKTTTSNTNTNSTVQTQPTISSLTCTKEGNKDVFLTYGEVISGKEEVIAMYSDDYLTSFGTNLRLEYDNEEAAQFGESAARDAYNKQLSASGLTTDPFDSLYSNINNVVTATHQADGDDVDTSNARVLGFYVVRGEVVDDPDTLIDNYETDGYICEEK